MNYKTYAEAKIANPDSEIVTTGKDWAYGDNRKGLFESLRFYSDVADHKLSDEAWVICNPADYCSSLKEFLESDLELVEGDSFTNVNGSVETVTQWTEDFVNAKGGEKDRTRYILSAAALNGGCKIPAKDEQWSIYSNTLPLCELTDEQAGKLVRHSGCVEHMNPNSGEWGATITPMWNRAGIYRIKQKSERELFIEAAIGHGIKPETQSQKQIFGELFDSGKFKYIDNTQHFGENI